MAVVYLPFLNDIFNTAPHGPPVFVGIFDLMELGVCTRAELCRSVGASVVVFHAVELEKWVKGRGFSGGG